MTRSRRIARCVLGLGLLGCFATVAGASPDSYIHWQSCPAHAHAGRSAALMRCGQFVPGTTLGGAVVRLRITRLQARPDEVTPHPIIHVPGGPGDPGGQSVPALQAWRQFQQAAGWPRDLVLFDPRGTGLSTPRPACRPVPNASDAHRLAHCFKRLGAATAAGLGAAAQVADLHRLIAALGQGSAVIWAESYGALIARRLAAMHPGDVQMLILESPVLASQPAARRQAAAFRRRRAQLMRGCDRHLDCRLAVPSLGTVIDGLIEARRRRPITIATARSPWRPHAMVIDGRTLRALIMLSAYDESRDAGVRRLLRHTLNQPSAIAALAPPLIALNRRRAQRAPVYWSTRCQFRPRASDSRAPTEPLCRQWPVAALVRRRTRINVPTLLIAGTRDVLTPAAAAAHAALVHPGWQFVPVRSGGHGVLGGNRCVQHLVGRFMAREGAWLDTPRCELRAVAVSAERSATERRSNDVRHASR